MVVCPIAIVAGCKKCPVFAVCPLKGVIGNYLPEPPAVQPPPTRSAKAKTRSLAAGPRQSSLAAAALAVPQRRWPFDEGLPMRGQADPLAWDPVEALKGIVLLPL